MIHYNGCVSELHGTERSRSRCSKTVDNTKAIIVLVASMQSRYHQVTHGVVKPIDNCNSSCPKCGCISKGGERMRAWSYDSLEGTPNTFWGVIMIAAMVVGALYYYKIMATLTNKCKCNPIKKNVIHGIFRYQLHVLKWHQLSRAPIMAWVIRRESTREEKVLKFSR